MEYNSLLLETAAIQGLKEDEFVRRGCRVTHGIMPDKGEYYTLTECGDDDNLVRIFASYIKKLAGEHHPAPPLRRRKQSPFQSDCAAGKRRHGR